MSKLGKKSLFIQLKAIQKKMEMGLDLGVFSKAELLAIEQVIDDLYAELGDD